MVQEGIVLGHRVSSKGIEVDRAKIATIEKLPPPKNVKGIRSFLEHAGFYRRFIKDFINSLNLCVIFLKKILHLTLMMFVCRPLMQSRRN